MEEEGLLADAFQAGDGREVAVVADDDAGEPAFQATEQPETEEEAWLLLKGAPVGAGDLVIGDVAAGKDGVEHGGVRGAFGDTGGECRIVTERAGEEKQAGEREGKQGDEYGKDDLFVRLRTKRLAGI